MGVGLGWGILYISMRRFHWTPEDKEVESKRRLFSPRHILDAFKTVLKPREDSKRLYIWLMMMTICLIISPFIGLGAVEYIYVRTRYGWEVDEYSTYQSYDSTIGIIGECIDLNFLLFFLWQFSIQVNWYSFHCLSSCKSERQ